MRSQQSLRQAVYTRLTSPLLTYQINDGSPLTLPAANVQPRAVWLTTEVAPLVCYTLNARAVPSRYNIERHFTLKLWTVSTSGPDECTELYEAVRSRIHCADEAQGAWNNPADLSRVATAGTLPIVVRSSLEERVSDVDYDDKTSRWYLVSEYSVIAV